MESLETRALMDASVLYRINTGGPSVSATPSWSVDTDSTPSIYSNLADANLLTISTTSPIDVSHPSIPAGTPRELFETERWDGHQLDQMRWDFPVTPGNYEVSLYFAETYVGTQGTGLRVFDVSIENNLVLGSYDIFAEVGGNKGIVKKFTVTSDSNLDIDFMRIIENPKINAIEIRSVITTPVNRAPVLAAIANRTLQAGTSQTIDVGATDPDGNAVALTTSSLPPFATFVDNGNGTGVITISPNASQVGTYSLTVTAADNGVPSLTDLRTFSIEVQPPLSGGGVISIVDVESNVTEGTPFVDVRIARTGGNQGRVSVDYTTVNASAVAGLDYRQMSGTLVLEDGQSESFVRVEIIDDFDFEGLENFSFTIDRVTGDTTLGTARTSLISLFDNGDPTLGSGTGVTARYFPNRDLLSPAALVRRDSAIDFDWGLGSPSPIVPADFFSIRWTGFVEPVYTDDYYFQSFMDDGVRVWVDNALIIDRWQENSALPINGGPLSLEAGRRYPLRVEYFDATNLAIAKLSWWSAQQPLEVIPTSRLYVGTEGRSAITLLDSTLQVEEGTGSVQVQLVRSRSSDSAATVNVSTRSGTAAGGSDFTSISQTVVFALGESTAVVNIPILDDRFSEPFEDFFVDLTSSVGAVIGEPSTLRIEVADNDTGRFVTDTLATGLIFPTAMDWGTNGLAYVTQKNGVVRVLSNGGLLTQPFTDLSSIVNDGGDRGLLSIAVHPAFPAQPYVYLAYTYDPPETATGTGLAARDEPGNRVARISRFTADVLNEYRTAIPGSELVIVGTNSTWANISFPDRDSTAEIELPPSCGAGGTLSNCIPNDSQSHTIGDLQFGSDGSLFATIGDGASYGRVDPRASRALDLNSLSGKLIRINPLNGQGYSDNPFFDGDVNSNRSKVYNLGLRNPFRFSIRPGTDIPYIGDVGWANWEEVNAGRGANFGWPYYEGGTGGNLPTGGYADLPEAQAYYASSNVVTAPVIARNHNSGNSAVVVGDFYSGTVFPLAFHGAMFLGDLNSPFVNYVTFDSNGNALSESRFIEAEHGIVQIRNGPDGFVYFINIFSGQVKRWRPEGTGSEAAGEFSEPSVVATDSESLKAVAPAAYERADVSRDGSVSPIDVLMVINALRKNHDAAMAETPWLDVNEDQALSPVDALVVINRLGRREASKNDVGAQATVSSEAEPSSPALEAAGYGPSESDHESRRKRAAVDKALVALF